MADPQAAPRARNEALKWVVHLVGDLHQPLHAADDGDRGGNAVQVALAGFRTRGRESLHRAWDNDFVQLALQARNRQQPPADVDAVGVAAHTLLGEAGEGNPDSWASESNNLARNVAYHYPASPAGPHRRPSWCSIRPMSRAPRPWSASDCCWRAPGSPTCSIAALAGSVSRCWEPFAPSLFGARVRAKLTPQAGGEGKAVNAFDESLASNSERAVGTRHPPFATAAESQGRAPGSSIDSWLLTRLRAFLGDPPVEFAVRDRALVGPSDVTPVARVTFANRRTLMPILADPALRFGDAYAEGSVAIDGDLVSLLEAVYRSGAAAAESVSLLTRARGALRRPHPNSLTRARANVHHHYDLGNAFYALWLDREMAYTCAYFPHPAATLEQAQIAKMDRVCRKLALKPGERVLEAGCGWGGLALFMARQYGVTVRALNVSREQIAYARERRRG